MGLIKPAITVPRKSAEACPLRHAFNPGRDARQLLMAMSTLPCNMTAQTRQGSCAVPARLISPTARSRKIPNRSLRHGSSARLRGPHTHECPSKPAGRPFLGKNDARLNARSRPPVTVEFRTPASPAQAIAHEPPSPFLQKCHYARQQWHGPLAHGGLPALPPGNWQSIGVRARACRRPGRMPRKGEKNEKAMLERTSSENCRRPDARAQYCAT